MSKKRLNILLVERGLAGSCSEAQGLIMAGKVLVNEVPETKAGKLILADAELRIKGDRSPFVSRGGLKLAHALKEFKIEAAEKVWLDVGASTGGFTDCLLQQGATKVYAIDVGYGQLSWKLVKDPRVVQMERVNFRHFDPKVLPEAIDGVVIDLSFISLRKILPVVARITPPPKEVVVLIKPQFEVGKGQVGKGGIVRESELHQEVVAKIKSFAEELGWEGRGVVESPILGADGNKEFLACFVVSGL